MKRPKTRKRSFHNFRCRSSDKQGRKRLSSYKNKRAQTNKRVLKTRPKKGALQGPRIQGKLHFACPGHEPSSYKKASSSYKIAALWWHSRCAGRAGSVPVLHVGAQLRGRVVRPLATKQPNLLNSWLRQARSNHSSCSSPNCHANSAFCPSQEQLMVTKATAPRSNPGDGVQGDLSLWVEPAITREGRRHVPDLLGRQGCEVRSVFVELCLVHGLAAIGASTGGIW